MLRLYQLLICNTKQNVLDHFSMVLDEEILLDIEMVGKLEGHPPEPWECIVYHVHEYSSLNVILYYLNYHI